MQTFDAAVLRTALPFDALIPALRAAFASHGTSVPARHVHTLGQGTAHAGTVLVMPAWSDAYLGIKTINIFPANGARGLPGLHASYMLYDATTGVPLALMDGNEITARRTAAAAALGASFLARPDARVLLVLGCGRIARLLPDARLTGPPATWLRLLSFQAPQHVLVTPGPWHGGEDIRIEQSGVDTCASRS